MSMLPNFNDFSEVFIDPLKLLLMIVLILFVEQGDGGTH